LGVDEEKLRDGAETEMEAEKVSRRSAMQAMLR
jgi:hypothetical protein